MSAKRKVVAAGIEVTPSARKVRPKVVLSPMPPAAEWSEEELDERWELIRVRGDKISADIKALLARVSSQSV